MAEDIEAPTFPREPVKPLASSMHDIALLAATRASLLHLIAASALNSTNKSVTEEETVFANLKSQLIALEYDGVLTSDQVERIQKLLKALLNGESTQHQPFLKFIEARIAERDPDFAAKNFPNWERANRQNRPDPRSVSLKPRL